MIIKIIDPQRKDVRALIKHADDLMVAMYPPESNHLDDLSELSKGNVCFVGAFFENKLAGIGAVKILADDGDYGEIKRVFVEELYRGKKVAQKIMAFLEAHLLEKNIFIARLETGDKQIEAIGLYKKLGYQIRGPYADYEEDPLSVFMEKILTPKNIRCNIR